MSFASATQMGNDSRAAVLPTSTASGPGFLGPDYNPADELSAPAQIGVHRGDSLESVVGAVKGVVYYTDMIGFGQSSSPFTKGMPGLKPLGVNYFLRTVFLKLLEMLFLLLQQKEYKRLNKPKLLPP